MEARRLIITGIVQGVGFRYHLSDTAHRLGLAGWVRNRRDGSVEAVIAGEADAIAAMIHWSRQGPPAAQVEQVYVEAVEGLDPPQGFRQLPNQ